MWCFLCRKALILLKKYHNSLFYAYKLRENHKAGEFMKKSKVCNFFRCFVGFAVVCLGVVCVVLRVPQCVENKEDAVIVAAALTLSKGSYEFENPDKKVKPVKSEKSVRETEKVNETTEEIRPVVTDFPEDYYNTFADHSDYEKFPVYEELYTGVGDKYENFFVKNATDYDLDIGATLKKELGFKFQDSKKVQVLIYHTHTGESYLDKDVGYYYSDYYPRTTDNNLNVVRVGEEIVAELESAGIGVIHDKTVHDTTYNGSYQRSRETVMKNLEKYPDIKVTIDIHRDSIGTDTYKMKPTFTYNGKKGAQIMIMTGYDPEGYYDFPDWEKNLRFALRLHQKCESKYGGMTRPLYFGNFAYNMNINSGSLLIEMGADSNTLEEAVYSGKLLGKALSEVLQNSE